jgi:hypothetical protein
MPRVNEIAAFKFPRVLIVIAPAFGIGWRWRRYLACEKRFDGGINLIAAGVLRKQSHRDSALPQQLADRSEFMRRLRLSLNVDAVDRNCHERIGSLARVFGVRTI